MALYDDIRRRNQSYFANANPGAGNLGFPLAPGVAAGQARMDQIAASGTYKSRRDDFRNKYPQFVNPSAQQKLQQFDLNQAYVQGYGAPSPTVQQGPGGPYSVSGGVANPVSPPPSVFQRFGSDVATLGRGIGTFAANVFNRGGQAAPSGNIAGGFMPPPLQAVQNFQQTGSFANNTQPRRYFDPENNYGF